MRVTFSDLVVTVAPEQMSILLEDWEWLVGPRVRPRLVTSAGDVFFSDASGAVYLLDIEEAHHEQVAPSQEEFTTRLRDPATAHRWLGVDRYVRCRDAQLSLAAGQFFCFIKPLCLGGEDSTNNVEASDPAVAIPMLGQIHNQIRHLPEGTPVNKIKFR